MKHIICWNPPSNPAVFQFHMAAPVMDPVVMDDPDFVLKPKVPWAFPQNDLEDLLKERIHGLLSGKLRWLWEMVDVLIHPLKWWFSLAMWVYQRVMGRSIFRSQVQFFGAISCSHEDSSETLVDEWMSSLHCLSKISTRQVSLNKYLKATCFCWSCFF